MLATKELPMANETIVLRKTDQKPFRCPAPEANSPVGHHCPDHDCGSFALAEFCPNYRVELADDSSSIWPNDRNPDSLACAITVTGADKAQ